MKIILPLLCGVVLIGIATAADERPAHRDDFKMNGISGGDFRSYISDAVHEDDHWAHSMRTFGTFHNHMHEMMSDLARHDAEERSGRAHVPEFQARISGGQWREYRRNLEDAGIESLWTDFVQVTELMHDRVHHAMYKAAVYDREAREREFDLTEYVGDRAPHPTQETIPDRRDVRIVAASRDAFRELVWHQDFEEPRLHASMQKMMVFNEMLFDLMNQWAHHGLTIENEACRPPEFGDRISGDAWSKYARQIGDCDEVAWRHLVQVADLMQERIHHMMYRMTHYVTASDQG